MRKKFSLLLIGLLIFLFGFSAYKIMYQRFKKGDVYPRYSSLRHDPMGTSIFFSSLEKMGCQVRILKEDEIPEHIHPRDTIMFILYPAFHFDQEMKNAMISFILDGGRIVLTDDRSNSLMNFFETRIERIRSDPNGKERETISEAFPDDMFDFSGEKVKVMNQSGLISDWSRSQIVYKGGDQNIILLLNHGKGDIIISSETYFISNESMAKHPPVTFLTWIMDGRKEVIVDEYHHGITFEKGISFLPLPFPRIFHPIF